MWDTLSLSKQGSGRWTTFEAIEITGEASHLSNFGGIRADPDWSGWIAP